MRRTGFRRLAIGLAAFLLLAMVGIGVSTILHSVFPDKEGMEGVLLILSAVPMILLLLPVYELRKERRSRMESERLSRLTADSQKEKAMRLELEQLQGRIENLHQAVEVMIWSYDPGSNKVLHISPACRKIYGMPEERFYADAALLWNSTPEEDERLLEQAWEAIAQRLPFECDIRLLHIDGSVRWVHSRIYPTADTTDAPAVVHGAMIDITGKKELELILQKELQLARIVQQSALSEPLKTERFHAEARYIPSRELGGDMYAWYPVDADRYGVLLMDVMGKGVPAALIGMSVRSLLGRMIPRLIEPDLVMQELNQHLRLMYPRNQAPFPFFITAIYLLIDTKRGEIDYVNAGHPEGLLATEDGQVRVLESTTIPIGLLEPLKAGKRHIRYTGDSRLLLYTDGLVETGCSPAEGAASFVQEVMAGGLSDQLGVFLDTIIAQSLRRSAGGESDDLCAVGVDLAAPDGSHTR